MDRVLDAAATGPRYLQIPKIAELIMSALLSGDSDFHRYDLHAFVVMANHVHMLVTPRVIDKQWLGPLKGFTGHAANKLLGLRGRPFWQDESYDHLVRSREELHRIETYIEHNPLKAGIVACATEFRWSQRPNGGLKGRPQAGLPATLISMQRRVGIDAGGAPGWRPGGRQRH